MVIDYCNFDNITVRNYLFEISKTKLSINRTKFSAIESFNGILIDIYGVSILFMNDIITDDTSNGFLNLQDVDFYAQKSIFHNINAPNNLLRNSFITLQKNLNNNEFILTSSNFIGHFTDKNGSVLNVYFFIGNFTLKNCSFQKNWALDYGGSIYIYYSYNISIEFCNFLSNQANQGGSIYYDIFVLKTSQLFILESNTFSYNKATCCGGALMFFDEVPLNILENNIFISNSAENYGNNSASEPTRIVFNDKQLNTLNFFGGNDSFWTFRIPSGIKLNVSLNFLVYDSFWQKVNKSFEE